jgi:proteasome accessory factor A
MSETTTLLKVGATDLVLRMIEAGVVMRDLTLENPIRADPRGQPRHDRAPRPYAWPTAARRAHSTSSRSTSPRRATSRAAGARRRPGEAVLDLWERTLHAVSTGDLDLVGREIDWVIKYQLIDRYRAKNDLPLSSPRIAHLDLAYHDIRRNRGLYYLLEKHGKVDRVARDLEVFEAKSVPPQTTRARLRGEFIRRAQEKRRDFTVDWVHLKLNDQAQRTVLCKDPFRSVDERVDKLIASM